MNKFQTRRDFLKTAGKLAAGAALVATVNPVINTIAEEKPAAPAHPFPYAKLDPAVAEERAYRGYYDVGGCCRGVADAIIGQLAEVVGYPFNQIPIDMYANGATGYGAGSLCGALGGAVNAIGLVCAPDDAKKLTAELFKWYRDAALPIYQPKMESKTSQAKSVNCVDSLAAYMGLTGVKMGDPARKERCAGVSGDVARKAVELLNAHFNL